MPNLIAHLGIARGAAERLSSPIINQNLGPFLLGSVSPDIRIITKNRRDDTHFVDLDFRYWGAGIKGLFDAHPTLADAKNLNDATKAFIIGYASHLLVDELWVLDFYRPYFGNRDFYPDALFGDVMDRALQLELDRRENEIIGDIRTLQTDISYADKGIKVAFIDEDTMVDWKTWIEGMLEWQFSWERLEFMSRRVASRHNEDAYSKVKIIVDDFLKSIDNSMGDIYRIIPSENIELYREKNIRQILNFAEEYLG
mgnify:CR=1 FL=1